MATTYYIDFTNGANTNPGTRTQPWKTHPYMQTGTACTSTGSGPSYTPTTGDQFIFKGSTTWPAACFGMSITTGGSVATPNYYGVDKTYFNSTSWTRPLFDLANNAPLATSYSAGTSFSAIVVKAANVTIDNLEIKRQFIKSGASGVSCGIYFDGFSGATGGLVENSFLHDWVSDTTNINAGWSNCSGGLGQNGGSYNAISNVISGQNAMDLTKGIQVNFGGCFQNATEAKFNTCSFVGQGALGYGKVHDNEFHHITNFGALNGGGGYTNGIHTNVIENTANSANTQVYNNLIHDNNPVGVTIYECDSASIYNNVIWNSHGPNILIGGGCNGSGPGAVAYILNNTVDCSAGGSCFQTDNKGTLFGTVNLKNNHWITNGNSTCFNVPGTCSTITTLNTYPNSNGAIVMNTATAAAQGYNTSNKYIPTLNTNGTVGAGTNLTALGITALNSDPESAPWFGGTSVVRPANTGTGSCLGVAGAATPCWDAGAYEFPTGSTNPPTVTITSPPVGTVSGTQTLTLTCTPQSPKTISQVYFQIDGATFGAVGSSSPYSLSWDTTTASNANHVIAAFCVDSASQSNSTTETVTVSNNMPGCFVSSGDFSTFQTFTTQTGQFTATFTVKPNANNLDDVVGFSAAQALAYTDMAAILRLNASGTFDVMNTSAYKADNVVSYTVGTVYSFSMVIDIIHHVYSVQLTSPSNVQIATNYAFRNTQASVASLTSINMEGSATPNTAQLCNLVITPTVLGTGGSKSIGSAQRFSVTLV